LQCGYGQDEVNGTHDPFSDAGCALLVVDHDGRLVRVNDAARRFVSADTAVHGAHIDEVFRVPEGAEPVGSLLAELTGSGAAERELLVVGAQGQALVLLWTAARTGDGVVLSATDVTVHHATTAELSHRLLHDPLTSLPNRVLLLERLSQAAHRLERQGGELAVLFLDVDRFKEVNDTRGHAAGDRLLVALADRLRAVLRPSDTIARFAGDEFVIVCEDVDGDTAMSDIAGRVIAAIERPFRLDGQGVALTVSIGLALARHSGADPDALLRDADAAMYRAKAASHRDPRSSVVVAGDDATLDPDELRRGLAEGELVVAYQPQISLCDGRLIGAEALARWHHPRLGTVLPAAFLRAAEGSGLVVDLGRRVLADACQRAVEWRTAAVAAGRVPPYVSVNLSLRELADPGLPAAVARALEDSGAEPSLLRVEISERSFVRDPTRVAAVLRTLQAIGVCSALDDVGRALPSLEPLLDLPLEELKLDRTWLRSAEKDGRGGDTMVEVARVARALGVRAVAEGIETDDELEAVRALEYAAAAGRWFASPQPADVVSQLVALDLRWPTDLT
jgi:diguanylate cyclase (GGDEF)-like protein